ncbi:hypothetical protein [Williamsia sterculiae]|uniref:hypothetical protein n=1 Tax=Williamsia sterculiae TaxID=1344003 RepID=UPI000970D51C|nr:hypothetical protein [Williamsia sterculiae]
MAGKKNELGATGRTVASNIASLRQGQRLGFAELSRILSDLGRPIPPLGLRRIEDEERRVDVDDLVSIAVALGVSPITLLMPSTPNASDEVLSSASLEAVSAQRLWRWYRAERPLLGDVTASGLLDFVADAFPEWRRIEYAAGVERLLDLRRTEIKAGSEDRSALDALMTEDTPDGDD